ncbi:MAG: cyclase family protein [Blastococcus sp.]
MTAQPCIDLSMPIGADMPTNRPDHFPPSITPYASIEDGGWAGSDIRIDSHCGTHVDAPSHFVSGGLTVDQIPLDVLIGPAQKITVPAGTITVTAAALAAVTAERVVIHTGWSDRLATDEAGYLSSSTHLDAQAAELLVRSGVRLVGIDCPSVDAPGVDPVHQILLGNGVIIVENLANTSAIPDSFTLVVAPLRLVDVDGSPARVVVIVDGEQS